MGSKTITISENAYRFLKRLKNKERSFSDVIISLQSKRQDVMSYAGILKSADFDSVEKIREELRKDWSRR